MNKRMRITGIVFIIVGGGGGWELLASLTGWECVNVVTKDLLCLMLGATWVWMSFLNEKGER